MAFGAMSHTAGTPDGGIYFQSPPDEFTGADLAACRTARTTAFSSGGSLASKLQDFHANPHLAVILTPDDGSGTIFETCVEGQENESAADTEWMERTHTVRGRAGRSTDRNLCQLVWEEDSYVRAGSSARNWSLGAGSRRGGVYIPSDIMVVSIGIEFTHEDPSNQSGLVAHDATAISLELIGPGDTDAERNGNTYGIIPGTEVTTPPFTPNPDPIYRIFNVIHPGVSIAAGSWIRPITTAPVVTLNAPSGTVARFSVWLS